MADNEPQNEQVDPKSAAARRVKSLLAARKEMAAENASLKAQLAQVTAHNKQLLSDTRLAPAQIHRKSIELAAHKVAMRDATEHFKKFDEFRGKVADALKDSPIPEDSKKIGIPHSLVQVLVEHPNGHKVAAHLLRHPEIARELVAKPLHMASAHIGELANEIEAAAKRAKYQTQAPAPVSTVKGETVSKDYTSPTANYQAYKDARNRGRI